MYCIKWALIEADDGPDLTFGRWYDSIQDAVMCQGELLRAAEFLGIQGQLQVGEIQHDSEATAEVGRVYRLS